MTPICDRMIRALDENRVQEAKRSVLDRKGVTSPAKAGFPSRQPQHNLFEDDLYGSVQGGFGMRHDISESSPDKFALAATGFSRGELG